MISLDLNVWQGLIWWYDGARYYLKGAQRTRRVHEGHDGSKHPVVLFVYPSCPLCSCLLYNQVEIPASHKQNCLIVKYADLLF
jgi:hypothetical protein